MKESLKNGLRSQKSQRTKAHPALKTSLKAKATQVKVSPKLANKLAHGPKKSHLSTVDFQLDNKLLVKMHDLMIQARVLEERLIRMYKQSDGYFWIGGPGEEAFNVALGMQIKKGQGLDYDFMHFHYRSTAIMLALGMNPMDAMRQMKNTATDPFSGGRNFANHFSKKEWNVVPITSTIETQYQTAIGCGIAHRRHGGTGITIVNGGDAGTAEGDFASCLVWASRPGNELPILIIVTNNQWGISTPASTQHGEQRVSDRGKAFGIKSATVNGNDVQESYLAIRDAMEYVRKERKPFLLEAMVSRLYGHSSATGANYIKEEDDCVTRFEGKLDKSGILTKKEMEDLRAEYTALMLEMSQKVREEPMPDPNTIYDYTYCGQKGRYW